jgi:hypothetical protein
LATHERLDVGQAPGRREGDRIWRQSELGLGCGGSGGTQDVYTWTGKDWNKTDGAAKAIAVGSDGVAWTVGADGKVWKRSGSSWAAANGCASGLAAGGSDQVYAPWVQRQRRGPRPLPLQR